MERTVLEDLGKVLEVIMPRADIEDSEIELRPMWEEGNRFLLGMLTLSGGVFFVVLPLCFVGVVTYGRKLHS